MSSLIHKLWRVGARVTVRGFFRKVTSQLPLQIDAHHIHIGKSIETRDRVIRKLMSLRLPGPAGSPGSNTDFIRLRTEFNMGMMAERHIQKV